MDWLMPVTSEESLKKLWVAVTSEQLSLFVVIQWKRREKGRRRCSSVALAFCVLEAYSFALGSAGKRRGCITQRASGRRYLEVASEAVASEGQEALLMGQLSAAAIL